MKFRYPAACRHGRRGSGPVGLLLVLCCAAGVGLARTAQAQGIDLSISDDGISLVANDASLADIASQLAYRTGIPVILSGDADPRLTLEIVDEPLEKVIAQLSANYLLKRQNNRPGAEILEVMLLTDDSGSVSDTSNAGIDDFLPSGEPTPELDNADDGSGQEPDGAGYFDDPTASEGDTGYDNTDSQHENDPGALPDDESDYSDTLESGVGSVLDQFADQPDVPNSEPAYFAPDQ